MLYLELYVPLTWSHNSFNYAGMFDSVPCWYLNKYFLVKTHTRSTIHATKLWLLAVAYPEKKITIAVKVVRFDLNVCNNLLSSDIIRWVVLIVYRIQIILSCVKLWYFLMKLFQILNYVLWTWATKRQDSYLMIFTLWK